VTQNADGPPSPVNPWADFDDYCDRNGIMPGEEPAAFAAFLHERTGWDGPMERVGDDLAAT